MKLNKGKSRHDRRLDKEQQALISYTGTPLVQRSVKKVRLTEATTGTLGPETSTVKLTPNEPMLDVTGTFGPETQTTGMYLDRMATSGSKSFEMVSEATVSDTGPMSGLEA